MKKLVLLSTGGTIASVQDPTSGLMMAGEQSGQELLAQCNTQILAERQIEVAVRSVFQVPSNQMSFERCMQLIETMQSCSAEQAVDGFVITHGTDTLEESAYFISLFWDSAIPVVLTGAQFSPTERNTDAFHNITNALLVAADEGSKKAGVVVAFNDHIFSAQYATKSHSSNLDGFSAPNAGPLGMVDFGRVHYFHYPARLDKLARPQLPLKKVEIVKSYMGMNSEVIDFHLKSGCDGLVIEAYGRGHVDLPTALKVEQAVQAGVPVVITSTCEDGEVAEVYGFKGALHDLTGKGGINGRDYDAKKARIKLLALLSCAVPATELQQRFDSY